MLDSIGGELGRLDEVELSPIAVRIRVTLDGLKPLIKETIVEFSSGEETIVNLEYEKLANHCQLCNSLLHEEYQCQNQSDQESLHQLPISNIDIRSTNDDRVQAPRPLELTSQMKSRHRRTQQEDDKNTRNKNNYSDRLDRHGKPFGVRPSTKAAPTNVRKSPINQTTDYRTKGQLPQKPRSPSDSHSYRRVVRDNSLARHRNRDPTLQDTVLRNDTRRRSLSFGHRTNDTRLIWKEKAPPSVEEPINTPFTTPVQHLMELPNKEDLQLHENIMGDLQEITRQYVNVSDPVESAARRQRVLEGESNDLMAKTAASLLVDAITKRDQLASNQAFYAALEKADETTPQVESQNAEQVILEPTNLSQPRKRGRPPGKNATVVPRPNQPSGIGAKKRRVIIQNSPRVRRSYSTNNKKDAPTGNKRSSQRSKPQVPKPPSTNVPATGEVGEPSRASKARSKARRSSTELAKADFHNPHSSLP